MKKAHVCPKCSARKIWLIEPFRLVDDTLAGQPVAVVAHQTDGAGSFFRVPRREPKGVVDLYVCAACGYSEMWARDIEGLVEDPSRGVRLLDATGAHEGPFR